MGVLNYILGTIGQGQIVTANFTFAKSLRYYVFSGSGTATGTLPVVTSNEGLWYSVKNRGSATLTISGTLYNTSAVSSFDLTAGASCRLECDGVKWNVFSSTSGGGGGSGTMSLQDADDVNITGGVLDGVVISNSSVDSSIAVSQDIIQGPGDGDVKHILDRAITSNYSRFVWKTAGVEEAAFGMRGDASTAESLSLTGKSVLSYPLILEIVPGSPYTVDFKTSVVNIAAGTITGITDLAVADGGTGASTAANARTNLGLGTVATLASDTDTGLAANSDSRVATQKATKSYIDAAVIGLLDYKGATNCSGNPNYPSALKGDAYVVSTAGKIGGASGTSVDIGDWYIANADNAGGTEASVGTSWNKIEHNLIGALLAANNLSDLASASTARTNLGLAIGTNVQAFSSVLVTYAGISPSPNVQTLLGSSNYAAFRSSLGLSTMATQSDASVTITGGTIAGVGIESVGIINSSLDNCSIGTDSTFSGLISGLNSPLGVSDGGTGATNAGDARANLGLSSVGISDLSTNLLLWWTLNGTFSDSSGNGNNGAKTGTTNYVTDAWGNGGGAFEFNGSTKIVASGLLGEPVDVTISGWVRVFSIDGSGSSDVFGLGSAIALRLDSDSVEIVIEEDSSHNWQTHDTLLGSIVDNGWHHFAIVVDDSNDRLAFYWDGIQKIDQEYTSSIYYGSGLDFTLGQHPSGTFFFRGQVDDVRVYASTLPLMSIKELAGMVPRASF